MGRRRTPSVSNLASRPAAGTRCPLKLLPVGKVDIVTLPVGGETTSAAARFRALACGKYGWQSRAMEFDLDAFVAATLAEDLGEGGDITSAAVIPADARFEG